MSLIDAFEPIETLGDRVKTTEALLTGWIRAMSQFPEIYDVCTSDYTEAGFDWQTIALTRIMPYSLKHWSCLQTTYHQLKKLCHMDTLRAGGFNPTDFEELMFVLYHGLGNGAGWAHAYDGKPAIWLGIDKLCELGWTTTKQLKALIVHEAAHLWHAQKLHVSLPRFAQYCNHPIFRLVAEGIAMVYETTIDPLGSRSEAWFKACEERLPDIKKLYAQSLRENNDAWQRFFGDWHTVENLPDTGYFIGKRLVDWLTQDRMLEAVAVMSLPTLTDLTMHFLEGK